MPDKTDRKQDISKDLAQRKRIAIALSMLSKEDIAELRRVVLSRATYEVRIVD